MITTGIVLAIVGIIIAASGSLYFLFKGKLFIILGEEGHGNSYSRAARKTNEKTTFIQHMVLNIMKDSSLSFSERQDLIEKKLTYCKTSGKNIQS